MSTLLGSNAHLTYGSRWTGGSTLNQSALLLAIPAGGPWKISRLGIWAAGKDVAVSTRLCVWTAHGTLVAETDLFTMASRPYGTGESVMYEADLTSPYTTVGGINLFVGLSRDPTKAHQYDTGGTGETAEKTVTGSWPGAMTGFSYFGQNIQAWLYYDPANNPPNAPTLSSPIGGVKTDDATPTLVFSASDPDAGDTLASYNIQVSTDSTFATVTHWNDSGDTVGISGWNVSRAYAGTALSGGVTYYWRAAATDNNGATGAWSAVGSFKFDAPPNAPTLTSPTNGARITTATPTLAATGSDPDAGDTLLNYDLQVSTDSTFSTVTHWNVASQTTGISGWNVSRVYAGTVLARQTAAYYWRMRMRDQGGWVGAWSAVSSFYYKPLPTTSGLSPVSAGLATIANLSALALWTAGGTDAQPQFGFTPHDDTSGLTKYHLLIYNDNAGAPGTVLYDSGETLKTMPSDVAVVLKPGVGVVNGTQYWWELLVFNGYEWSAALTTAFKVRWAQGLYEFDTGGAGSSAWLFLTGAVAQQVAIIFRSATSSGGDAATGKTAWKASIGDVTVQEWMQWLVRLSTPTAGTGATLASGTFKYRAQPTTPDRWSAS